MMVEVASLLRTPLGSMKKIDIIGYISAKHQGNGKQTNNAQKKYFFIPFTIHLRQNFTLRIGRVVNYLTSTVHCLYPGRRTQNL